MKKGIDIAITFAALALGIFFLLSGGGQFAKMLRGAQPLGEGESFAQVQGRYVAYEAAYPVASYEEEYYSGDPDRVKTMGYVVYDEKRRAFLYVTVPEQKDAAFHDLLWNLHLAAQMRQGKEMSPARVEGTVEPADEETLRRVLTALRDSEVVAIYAEYSDSDGDRDVFYETYYSDAYGKALVEMGETLEERWPLAECWRLASDSVDGMAKSDVWLTALAAAASLLIFAARLILLFTGGKTREKWSASDPQSKLGQFVEAQQDWVEEWCDSCLRRSGKLACLSSAGSIAIFLAIGILVHVSARTLLTFYLPLGVLVGEGIAVLFWMTQGKRSRPEKILCRLEKSIRKELASPGEQEAFAEDLLKTGSEWEFGEKNRDTMLYGRAGERYWAAFSGTGAAVIVDSARLAKIETETISGQVRSGKVRVSYLSYEVRFFYRSDAARRGCDKIFSFDTQDAAGHFMLLARKRTGDGVEITAL